MKRILIAEDDSFTMNVYTTRLKKDGYAIEMAPDGKAAWEKIKKQSPDLLLLDMTLPLVSGYELLQMIRDNPSTKNLSVVIISNTRKEDLPHDISGLNVSKYFVKVETPIDEIASVVKEILQ